MTVRYGLLSTHPPTRCGLATFNAALAAQLTVAGSCSGGIVRVTAADEDQRPGPGVVHTWSAGSVTGWLEAAEALNAFDVAIVQHEYGIYPGPDGGDVLPLLRRLTVPSIVVLHTVLGAPTSGQRALLEAIAATAGAVVTMTDTARSRLLHGYAVDPGKVKVIPHGTGGPHAVDYQPQYHDGEALGTLIRSADVVVLPYDSLEQVTSGVLTEAVAAGIPVVATTFPHAVELLSDGRGLLVPHRNPAALATAIRRVLTDPAMAARLSRPRTPALRWPAVAARYAALAARLIAASAIDVGREARPAGSRS